MESPASESESGKLFYRPPTCYAPEVLGNHGFDTDRCHRTRSRPDQECGVKSVWLPCCRLGRVYAPSINIYSLQISAGKYITVTWI